jgi:hypothetical protein
MPIRESNVIGVIVINIDPVIHLGPIAIHWYGVMYAIAFYVAYRFAVVPLAERAGVARDVVSKITVWTIVIGLIGGRLYYVVQQPDRFTYYLPNPIHIIAFWEGGMAFFGAIIAGFLTLTVCAWRYGLNRGWPSTAALPSRSWSAHRPDRQPDQRRHPRFPEHPPVGDRLRQPGGGPPEGVSTLHAGTLHRLPTRRSIRGAGHLRHRTAAPPPLSAARPSGRDRDHLRRRVFDHPADRLPVQGKRARRAARVAPSAMDLDRHAAHRRPRPVRSLAVDKGSSGEQDTGRKE